MGPIEFLDHICREPESLLLICKLSKLNKSQGIERDLPEHSEGKESPIT